MIFAFWRCIIICGSWSPFYFSLNLMHARLPPITEAFTLCNNKLLHNNILAKLHIYDRRCDSSTKDWVNKVWVQLTHHLKVRVTDGNLLTRLGARDVIASKNVFETLSIESQLRVLDKAGLVKVLEDICWYDSEMKVEKNIGIMELVCWKISVVQNCSSE